MNKYDISIVICVADDLRIEKMLSSIKDHCEVVVVLNGATQEVKKIVGNFKNDNIIDLKIVEIPERNLSKARNIGTLLSTYDKVVFYDSDCVIVGDALKLYDNYLNDYLLVDGLVKFRNDTFTSNIISVVRNMGIPGYALCPSMGMHKDIKKIIGYFFDEEIKWIEDSELNKRVKDKELKVGFIKELTCIHDNLTFKKDLKSAYRYGTGVRIAAKKGLHKKRPTANWNLIVPCFKKNILSGIYCVLWNLVYVIGYYLN